MIDTLPPPMSFKRSLSEMAREELNFFFAPTSLMGPDLKVNESDFDFFPSTDSSPSQHDEENDQLSVDSHSGVGDSPPPSSKAINEVHVAGSPDVAKLDVMEPTKPQPVVVDVLPRESRKPEIDLPSCVRGEVGVTAPLTEGTLGIRCSCDHYGESCEIGENGIRTVWYCDRPFPRFEAQLFDKESGFAVEPVDEDGNPWTFELSVTDGFGDDASDKVYGNITTRDFPVGDDGIASIAGLRFSSVSSKAGGSFQISLRLKSPHQAAQLVTPWESDPIQVLSYRLFHAPKVAFENLRPQDSVGKMKGIGSLYAKRFAAIGVRRIIDLAQVDLTDTSVTGVERVHVILNALRKDRGAMTRAKLGEYIVQARSIVNRDTTSPTVVKETKTVAAEQFLPSAWPSQSIFQDDTTSPFNMFSTFHHPETSTPKRRRAM